MLQKVCRRWRSSVTLMNSQMPLISSASPYSYEGPTCIPHLSISSMERFFTSQVHPCWGCIGKITPPENLLRQLQSGHLQRNVSCWRFERCLLVKVTGNDQPDRACDCSSTARPQTMNLHLCHSFQCLGYTMCCLPGCYLMPISCVLTSQ